MKIPDDVLDQAYKKFGAFHSRWLQNPDHIEKVVSFVVERSIDYEAAKKCPSCEGSGKVPEDHQPGLTEWLGCRDCGASGEFLNDAGVRAVLRQAGVIGDTDE